MSILGIRPGEHTTRWTEFRPRLLGWLLRYSATMRARLLAIFTILIMVLLAAWALRQTTHDSSTRTVFEHQPLGVMGTVSKLVLVTDQRLADTAPQRLESAEAELRRLETLLSTWIASSQMSRFNDATQHQNLHLATEVTEVLSLAHDMYGASAGAFDITARPLFEVWSLAEERQRPPTQMELDAARAESRWDHIRFGSDGVTKALSTTRVDVDGIAKGYAIDRALEVLRRSRPAGGMVEVGGDLRLFGEGPEGGLWKVAIQSPFADRPWAEIELQEGAVCSSGDYSRFIEIGDRRFSHIIDPRSGQPAAATRAVTMVGPDAATADAWATALSILGVAGLDLLSSAAGLEAMIVTGAPDGYQVNATPGFRQLLVRAEFDIAD